MATKSEEYQWLKKRHAEVHGFAPTTSKEVIHWAVEKGLYKLPDVDPYQVAADQLSRALKEEHATSKRGRSYRVNHSIRKRVKGQMTMTNLWVDMEHGSHEDLELAFNQRREQTAGDCYQLYDDKEVYKEIHPDRPEIEVEFDFTQDILEREAMMEMEMAV